MSEIQSLKSLLTPSKHVEAEFPGFEGFKVQLTFLTREALVNMRKKSTKAVYKGRQATEEFNDELFLKLYCAAAIRNWSGLKYEYLNQLVPSDIDPKDYDKEMPYSEENALELMKASGTFDSFISETVSDLAAFTKSSTAK